jgi:hypothetical protein
MEDHVITSFLVRLNVMLCTPISNRRLPIIATLVRSYVGLVVENYGTWAGFIRVLRLPLPISVPSAAPYSLNILSKTLYSLDTNIVKGRAIAQAVSRCIPTAAARVQTLV